jgi:hypothetical protein
MVLWMENFIQTWRTRQFLWIAKTAFERGDGSMEAEGVAVSAEYELVRLPKRNGFRMLRGQRRLAVYGHPHGSILFMDGDHIVFMVQLQLGGTEEAKILLGRGA